MGTVGSYTGSGGPEGDALRDDVSSWLDSLPAAAPDAPDAPRLDPDVLRRVVELLHVRPNSGGGGDGPGGGGGGAGGYIPGSGRRSGGGPTRSIAASASSGGRAAAAAYAFQTGDANTLAALGLDYAKLQTLNTFQVAQAIVEAACGQPNSAIEDDEQRLVAAEVAEWVLDSNASGYEPTPEEITRHTIAAIVAETALVETADLAEQHPRGALTETEIRDIAEALAAKAELSVNGVTDTEFQQAIESGLGTLRRIQRGDDG